MSTRFNKYKKRLITLRDGEQFCKKCDGKGIVSNRLTIHDRSTFVAAKYLICSECLGDGKIDWVEKVTGKAIVTQGGIDGQKSCP